MKKTLLIIMFALLVPGIAFGSYFCSSDTTASNLYSDLAICQSACSAPNTCSLYSATMCSDGSATTFPNKSICQSSCNVQANCSQGTEIVTGSVTTNNNYINKIVWTNDTLDFQYIDPSAASGLLNGVLSSSSAIPAGISSGKILFTGTTGTVTFDTSAKLEAWGAFLPIVGVRSSGNRLIFMGSDSNGNLVDYTTAITLTTGAIQLLDADGNNVTTMAKHDANALTNYITVTRIDVDSSQQYVQLYGSDSKGFEQKIGSIYLTPTGTYICPLTVDLNGNPATYTCSASHQCTIPGSCTEVVGAAATGKIVCGGDINGDGTVDQSEYKECSAAGIYGVSGQMGGFTGDMTCPIQLQDCNISCPAGYDTTHAYNYNIATDRCESTPPYCEGNGVYNFTNTNSPNGTGLPYYNPGSAASNLTTTVTVASAVTTTYSCPVGWHKDTIKNECFLEQNACGFYLPWGGNGGTQTITPAVAGSCKLQSGAVNKWYIDFTCGGSQGTIVGSSLGGTANITCTSGDFLWKAGRIFTQEQTQAPTATTSYTCPGGGVLDIADNSKCNITVTNNIAAASDRCEITPQCTAPSVYNPQLKKCTDTVPATLTNNLACAPVPLAVVAGSRTVNISCDNAGVATVSIVDGCGTLRNSLISNISSLLTKSPVMWNEADVPTGSIQCNSSGACDFYWQSFYCNSPTVLVNSEFVLFSFDLSVPTASCPAGQLLNGTGPSATCTTVSAPICNFGTTFDATTDLCTKPMVCPSGGTLDTAGDFCMVGRNTICPIGIQSVPATASDMYFDATQTTTTYSANVDSSAPTGYSCAVGDTVQSTAIGVVAPISVNSVCIHKTYTCNGAYTGVLEQNPAYTAWVANPNNATLTVPNEWTCHYSGYTCPEQYTLSGSTCNPTGVATAGTHKCFDTGKIYPPTCSATDIIIGTSACGKSTPGNNHWQCSPYDCADMSNPANTTTTDSSNNTESADGTFSADGQCNAKISIFSGTGKSCRRSGLLTGGMNCCDPSIAPADTAANGMIAGVGGAAVMLAVAAGLMTTGYGAIAAVIIIVIAMLLKCQEEDMKTMKAVNKKRCHEIGSWCSTKWAGVGCVQQKKGFCCYESMLARISQEQGRPMLNTFNPLKNQLTDPKKTGVSPNAHYVGTDKNIAAQAWGLPEAPNCRGFTMDEFTLLDFGNIDLSEWADDMTAKLKVTAKAAATNATTNVQNKVTNAMSGMSTSGH